MTFLHPEFIYMMLPLLIILFGLLLTQGEVQEQFFSPEMLAKLRVDTNQISAKARNLFYFLMFLFIILALAGPVIEKGSAKVNTKGDPFYIALDISTSMLCNDLYPNRLEYGKQKIAELLKTDTRREIGLIAFAQSSYLVSPPTLDHTLLRFLLKPMQSGSISEQGTNILTLLKTANTLFDANDKKNVLLISDGGDRADFLEEIAYAKKHGLNVYVAGVGTQKGSAVPNDGGGFVKENGAVIISRINPRLASLAEASGGRTVQAEDLALFLEIESESVSQGEEKPIYSYLFIIPIAIAMLMLVLATSSFYRGEKYYLPSLLLFSLLLTQPQTLEAGLFDYKRLDAANRAYEDEDYRESSSVYKGYALEHESIEATYNAANGYYKMQWYKRAVGLYESIHFVESEKNHELYHNLGNALAKLGSNKDLKKAVHAYEKALKFQEDKETRENLERVKKALKKMEDEKQHDRQNAASSLQSRSDGSDSEVGEAGTRAMARQYKERAMNDREAKKWFKLLDQHQQGHLYKIEVTNPEEGADDARPW